MNIYHALINALSAHMIHINLNMIFYTHVEHSPAKTIYIKYYTKTKTKHLSDELCRFRVQCLALLCFVPINSILLNVSCVWIYQTLA